MEADLTCTVCLDLYKDPHLLPCSHNLCRECVLTLIKDNSRNNAGQAAVSQEADESQIEDSSISQSMTEAIHQLSGWISSHIQVSKTSKTCDTSATLTCPNCRAKHDVGPNKVDQFPKNLSLASIVSTYKNSRRVCDTMTDSEDEIPVCNATDNDENKSDKPHENKEIESAEPNMRLCAKHGGKRNKMFCNTCNVLVCSSCALFGGHKGHDIIKLRSALRMGKRLLEDELVKVEEMQLSLLKRKEAIFEYSCKLDEIKATRLEFMRKEIIKIVNKIQGREKEITEEIQKDVQEKKDILDKFQNDAVASAETVQNLSSDILNVLNISDPMEFLCVYMPVVKRARDSSISLLNLDPTLQIVSGQPPDFKYLNKVLRHGLMKNASPERTHTVSMDENRTTKKEESKKGVPGHIVKCQFMEPFYVVEDLIDVAIGAGGANIQEARLLDGITSVELEFGDMCSFKFYGTSQQACDDARDILQQAMIRYMSKN